MIGSNGKQETPGYRPGRISAAIWRGAGSNVYGQFVTLAVQFGSLPFLIRFWGTETYGLWIALAAVPAYLSISDFGFGLAAATDMSIAIARGDEAAARRTFQSTVLLLLGISGILFGLGMTLVFLIPDGLFPHSLLTTPTESRAALAFLGSSALLALNYSLVGGVLRAQGRYATGIMLGETTRLLESIAVLIAAGLGLGIAGAAAAGFCTRVVGFAAGVTLVQLRVRWARIGFGAASKGEILRLWRPAVAVMVIPLGFAINLQGPTLLVASILGFQAVAIFTAARTIARVVYQVVGIINHAVMPEVSRALGRNDRDELKLLLDLNFRYSMLGAGVCGFVLALIGPAFAQFWSHGRLAPPTVLVVVLVLSASLQSQWNSSANMLLAVNQQSKYAYWFVASALGGVATSIPLTHLFGLTGAGISTIFPEMLMLIIVIPKVRSLLVDR